MSESMPHLIIVCPEPYTGRGGISTAVGGFLDGFELLGISPTVIASHVTGAGKVRQWFKALKELYRVCKRHRNDTVVWFHCGAWFSMFRKWTLALVASFHGAKTVIHLHSTVIEQYQAHPLGRWLFKRFLNAFDRVFVVTPWWADWLKVNFDVDATPLFNPLNKRSFDGRVLDKASLVVGTDSIHLVSMSRLVEGKGFELLLETMTRLPDSVILTIAGDGYLMDSLRKKVVQFRLSDRVTFAGWVEKDEKERLLEQADILVLVSQAESFGMAYIESMVKGTPVIGLARGPILDVVTDDVGRLITCESPVLLAEAITYVAANASEMGAAARQRAEQVFHPYEIAMKARQLLKIDKLHD
ncbi:glycosyltransferase family 4 protein [Shewanella sp. FJAT-52076]|uniref:glycosyltransferase family 4 protein n=1 Tax=Shewanella sp. FJAT-52076 TaxID=2864202 RepID=UPI001C6591D1|nr:glycosyltransferase family 4 protein [Shewanella sp. FJAT-52076]QYJ74037.1 glycosyltransferase family 4 protein [Shewanella sp. FJAT-52076]